MYRHQTIAALACALAVSQTFADTTLDLTASSSALGVINGAQFEVFNLGNSGTGTFPAFVQVQATGFEQGYNTSGTPRPFNEGSSGTFNHNILMTDLVLSANGQWYEFSLDLNESQSQPPISLTSLRIFTDSRASLTISDFSFQSERYSLDLGDNATVLLDTTVSNAGSGRPDMRVSVPVSYFGGALATDYVYLYSAFEGCESGFEEWGLRTGGGAAPDPVIPGPATLALASLAAAAGGRRRR